MTKPNMLIFGAGYSAKALIPQLIEKGWQVTGTTRSPSGFEALSSLGARPLRFDAANLTKDERAELEAAIVTASHLLISIAPEPEPYSDPVLTHFKGAIEAASPKWIGYLSTVGVYGDYNGAWVDETTALKPRSPRSRARVKAEDAWLGLQTPAHIFRLAGIYGPGRGPLEKLRKGEARRIIKAGQVFNRIHVADIAKTLLASLERPNPGRIYNVADDFPAPPQDVISHAATLIGVEIPPAIPFAEAEMSPMGRSFYSENKRVDNARLHEELGVDLTYPTYREGLASLL